MVLATADLLTSILHSSLEVRLGSRKFGSESLREIFSVVRILRFLSRFVPDDDSLETTDGVPPQAGAMHSHGRWFNVRDYSTWHLHKTFLLTLH